MAAVVAILTVVVLVLGAAVIQLQRSHTRLVGEVRILRRRVDLRTAGTPDPTGSPTIGGASGRAPSRDRLLAFLSPDCTTCATFWHAFAVGVELPLATDLEVVTEDLDAPPVDGFAARVASVTDVGIMVRHDSAAWRQFDVPVAPYFVLVDATGAVRAEGAANTWELVRTILG